jgi:hypothetical protein
VSQDVDASPHFPLLACLVADYLMNGNELKPERRHSPAVLRSPDPALAPLLQK